MKYVVLQTGGKQYRASEGDILEVEHLSIEKGQKHTFSEILLYTNDGTTQLGGPFVFGVSVIGLILDHVKGDKIRVAKFKAKARYRKVKGHRQSLSRVKIEAILDGVKSKPKAIDEKPAENIEMEAEVVAEVTKKVSKTRKTKVA